MYNKFTLKGSSALAGCITYTLDNNDEYTISNRSWLVKHLTRYISWRWLCSHTIPIEKKFLMPLRSMIVNMVFYHQYKCCVFQCKPIMIHDIIPTYVDIILDVTPYELSSTFPWKLSMINQSYKLNSLCVWYKNEKKFEIIGESIVLKFAQRFISKELKIE